MSRSLVDKLERRELEELILETINTALDGCLCETKVCVHSKIIERLKKAVGAL